MRPARQTTRRSEEDKESDTGLVVAAILLPIYPGPVLFIIAAVTMLLLFMGIRNAWDVVTYMAIERSQPQDTSQD
jgi:hypothetical protein